MRIEDLRNFFTNCNDRLIEVSGDFIYYAEEKVEEGLNSLLEALDFPASSFAPLIINRTPPTIPVTIVTIPRTIFVTPVPLIVL